MKNNSVVSWGSSSSGVYKKKSGVVVEVVPKGSLPDRERLVSLHRGAGVGEPRNHESYVIAVDCGKHKGSSVKYSWPRVSALVEEAQNEK